MSTQEGINLKKEIGANHFIECSAKSHHGIDRVLNKAVKASINGVSSFVKQRLCFCW